jgi:hypothetical protein
VSGEALLQRICVSMFRVERKLMAKSKRVEDLLHGIQLGAAGAATAVLPQSAVVVNLTNAE